MNIKEEIASIEKAIAVLRERSDSYLLKEYSEACTHGAEILEDYLKYLNRPDGTSYISEERGP